MRWVLQLLLPILLIACSHPLEIVGQGDIASASGERDCTLQDFQSGATVCSENRVATDYAETYTAVAHAGWKFYGWQNYCSDTGAAPCSFDFQATAVGHFWGITVPPLVAVFVEDNVIPPSEHVIVNGRTWAQVDLFSGVTWNEVNAVCPGGDCDGLLNAYDLTGWRWASVDDINALFNSYIGTWPLGPGPDSYSEFNTSWGSAVFNDGFRPTSQNSTESLIWAHMADSESTTNAYITNFEHRDTSTWVQTNRTQANNAVSHAGAWFYQPQKISDTIIAAGREWAQPDLFRWFSWLDITAQCPSGICGPNAVLNGYAMNGWVLATVEDANTLFNYYIGNDVLGPGPDSYSSSGSAWGHRMLNAGFRATLGEEDIEGLLLDLVEPQRSEANIGAYSAGSPSNARTYGSHRIESGYGITGAWFYRQPRVTDDSVTLAGREWAQPRFFSGLSWEDVNSVCSVQGPCSGVLNGIDVSGWHWASIDDALALLNSFGVNPPLEEARQTIIGIDTGWYQNLEAAGFQSSYTSGDDKEIHGWTSELDEDLDYRAYSAFMTFGISEDEDSQPPFYERENAGSSTYYTDSTYSGRGVWLYRDIE